MDHRRGKIREPQYHNVLFEKEAWLSNPSARMIRTDTGLLIPMFAGPHAELHREIPTVPLLDSYHAFVVYQELEKTNLSEPLVNIEKLLFAMRRAMDVDEYIRNNEIRLMVGQAAILAVEKQVPFIREGLYTQAIPKKIKQTKVDRRRGGLTY